MGSYFKVRVENFNETFVRVQTNNGALREDLAERFAFEVPGARFMPKHIANGGDWDGFIRLYQFSTGLIYKGLLKEVGQLLKEKPYGKVEVIGFSKLNDETDEILETIDSLQIPEIFEQRDYQIETAVKCVNKRRLLVESPTSSGKSLIIYMAMRNILNRTEGKCLITVPTITLVDQLAEDFRSFGYNGDLHLITGGVKKDADCQVYISTWQSLQNQKREWFQQFQSVMVDEVHTATANVLKGIVENCIYAQWRLGFTGTLKDTPTDIMVLRGLFGEIHKSVSLKELIERGIVAKPTIEMVRLIPDDSFKKTFAGVKGDFFLEREKVNGFKEGDSAIMDMIAENKNKNGIVLYSFNAHGKRLIEAYKKRFPGKPFYVINGSVSKDIRSDIRRQIDQCVGDDRGVTLFATFQTMSTGVSIKNLDYGILASSLKSKIIILQSLGRLLRKSSSKFTARLYDVWYDLSHLIGKNNFLKEHASKRLSYYEDAGLDVEERNVKISSEGTQHEL